MRRSRCPGCETLLRSDNTRGACADCINRGKAPRKPARLSVERRFKAAAKALGFDAEALVGEFMAAWLEEKKQ